MPALEGTIARGVGDRFDAPLPARVPLYIRWRGLLVLLLLLGKKEKEMRRSSARAGVREQVPLLLFIHPGAPPLRSFGAMASAASRSIADGPLRSEGKRVRKALEIRRRCLVIAGRPVDTPRLSDDHFFVVPSNLLRQDLSVSIWRGRTERWRVRPPRDCGGVARLARRHRQPPSRRGRFRCYRCSGSRPSPELCLRTALGWTARLID